MRMMHNNRIFFIACDFMLPCMLFFFFATSPGHCEEGPRLSGTVQYKFTGYRDIPGKPSRWKEATLRADLKGNIWGVDYLLEPIARWDHPTLSHGVIDEISDNDRLRHTIDIEEAWLSTVSGKNYFGFGKKKYAWGKADVYNPIDRLNPRDFTDPIDSKKIGIFSAEYTFTAERYSFEFVAIPTFTHNRLPPLESRWSLFSFDIPWAAAKAPQFAARMNVHHTGWDASVVYYEGIEAMPVVIAADSYLRNYRMTLVGATASVVFHNLEAHIETGLFHPHDDLFDTYVENVVGLNYSWSNQAGRQRIVVVEYAKEFVVERSERPQEVFYLPIHRPFKNSLLLKSTVEITSDDNLELEVVFNLPDYDYFLETKWIRQFSDTINGELGMDIFHGATPSTFGRFRDNDRVFILVKFTL